MARSSTMTVAEAIELAKENQAAVKCLTPYPLRSEKARQLEYLARLCIDLPKEHPERAVYMHAIFALVRPLLREVFFRSRLPNNSRIRLDDFIQDSNIKILSMIDRFYDPKRGTFVSFVITAGRQAAYALAKQAEDNRRRYVSFRDGFGFDDDGEPIAKGVQCPHVEHDVDGVKDRSQLYVLMSRFSEQYSGSPDRDETVSGILTVMLSDLYTVRVPTMAELSEELGIPYDDARRYFISTIVLFNAFAAANGVTSLKELELWEP